MDAKIFRVNYKSDFILTLTSDAGWMTPFCIKFWTGSPRLAYYASYDGETHVHCTYDPADPTKLTVQFDDHHLPIGNLKYQVAYHFTVADFPENTEDEVTNQANVTTVIDGDTYQVMLDLNGETAPEIQFALPAYANELQRIQNEQTRIAQEQQRIIQEQTRVNQEAARVTEFNVIKAEALADHQRANEDHSRATSDHQNALADRSQAASDHSRAQSDHNTATSDHSQANSDHSRAQSDHNTALSDHQTALSDHTQANTDHTRAESDHTRATADSSTAAADHRTASTDHTQANTDHTRAESDHQRVETDLAEVEEFSNSLGAYDISAAHATGSTLATYPDLATALGPNGSNIPEALRKGGMSVKFVLTYDNNYVQWRLVSKDWSTDTNNWVAENEDFRNEVMQDVNEAIASIAPIEITGDVTNAPDEEDLTSINVSGTDVLKFKDKAYSPLTYSGLGRVYLRKNIVNGVNVLTQEMLPSANTIYVIQYDYELAEDITVLENCLLEFDGGSISGEHTITGQNTGINAGLVKIFNTNVILAGSWNVTEAYPEWFCAKGNGVTDDRHAIQKCIDSFQKTKLSKPVYLVSSYTDATNKVCIVIPRKKILEGNALSQYTMTTIKVADDFECNSVLGLNGSWICIKYLGVFGGNYGDRDNQYVLNGIKSYDETQWNAYLTFDHVFIDSCVNGFNVLTYICDVLSCRVDNANGTAFRFGGSNEQGRGTSVNMQKCGAYDCYGTVYDLSHLSYSTILCCSADRGGFNPNNLTDENIYPVFKLDYSRSLTLISCACESAYKTVSSIVASNLSFIDCLFITNQLTGVYTYFIQYSNFIKFENTQLATLGENDSTVFVHFDNQVVTGSFYNIVFSSCYYRKDSTIYVFDFNNINANYIHGIEINKISYQNEVSDIIPAYINKSSYEFKKVCVWNCNGPIEIANGLSLNNVPTLLKFNGNGKNLYCLQQTMIHKINNCEHIEFNNFTIRVGFASDAVSPLFFSISNSKVTFRNCTFRVSSSSNGTTWSADNIFDATDSDVKLVNCNIINPMNKAIVKDAALTKNSTYTIVKSEETQISIDCEWKNTSGTFANKPTNIPVGFKYFCTDKQTAEGATNGIEIFHKGNNVWVDALGRVVS